MLHVNQLTGFGVGQVEAVPPPTFVEYKESVSALNVYTFNSCNIGTPHSRRVVVLAIAPDSNAPDVTFASVTVGGVTATLVARPVGNGSQRHCWIYRASVPEGATADIILDYTGTSTGSGIAVGIYAIYPESAVPVDAVSPTNSAGSNPITLTDLAKTAGGVAVFVARTRDKNAEPHVFTYTGETVVRDRLGVLRDVTTYVFGSVLNIQSSSTTSDATSDWQRASETCFAGATWF